MEIHYKPKGVCAREIILHISGGIVKGATFAGGCHESGQGVGALVKDMPIDAVIERLDGICCGMRKTSCPDQLAKALKELQ